MSATTLTFDRAGQPYATLIEIDDGQVLTQHWTYADGRRESNVRLSPHRPGDAVTSAEIEALLAAHRAICAQPGFADAGRGEAHARAFLARTGGRGVLHAREEA